MSWNNKEEISIWYFSEEH